MRTQSAYRVLLSVKDRSVTIESVTHVEKVLPPSAPVEGAEQQYGTWFSLDDANGRPLYRRLLDNFLAEGVEVFTGEQREFERVHVPGLPRTLSILVPDLPGAETFALHTSAPPKGGRHTPARPIFAVNTRQLVELAGKGGPAHGR